MSSSKLLLLILMGLLIIAAIVWTGRQVYAMVSFQPLGDTQTYLVEGASTRINAFDATYTSAQIVDTQSDDTSPSAGTAPSLSASGVLPPEGVTIDIWFLSGPKSYDAEHVFASELERGRTEDGRTAYYLVFSEEDLNRFWSYWFDGAEEFWFGMVDLEAIWFDLQPGGVIVYANVDLGLGVQRVGAVFALAPDGRQFTFAGIDVDGQLYDTPPSGPLADVVEQIESTGNRALRELTFLDPDGNLVIQQLLIDAESVQVLAY